MSSALSYSSSYLPSSHLPLHVCRWPWYTFPSSRAWPSVHDGERLPSATKQWIGHDTDNRPFFGTIHTLHEYMSLQLPMQRHFMLHRTGMTSMMNSSASPKGAYKWESATILGLTFQEMEKYLYHEARFIVCEDFREKRPFLRNEPNLWWVHLIYLWPLGGQIAGLDFFDH